MKKNVFYYEPILRGENNMWLAQLPACGDIEQWYKVWLISACKKGFVYWYNFIDTSSDTGLFLAFYLFHGVLTTA